MDETAACKHLGCSDVLHAAIENLHCEVNEAEKKIKAGFQTMLSEASNKWERQYNASHSDVTMKNKEILTLTSKVEELEGLQKCLQQDDSKLRSELMETKKELTTVSKELEETNLSYLKIQEDFQSERSKSDREHELEVIKYKSTIQELSCSLKEYQTKFAAMTAKINQLSEKIITDKTSSDKVKKAISSQLSDQTSEAKKSALEVSKLKTDITNSNKALTTAKQTIKKLQLQLQEVKRTSESTITELHKQHSMQLKRLNEEIISLQHQLEELKRLHHEEIESMKANNQKSERDDFLDARISFLQHQNRREKVKIQEKQSIIKH